MINMSQNTVAELNNTHKVSIEKQKEKKTESAKNKKYQK